MKMTLPVSGQSPISLSYQKSSSAWWIANWWTSWSLIDSFPSSSLGSAPDIQPKPQCSRSCQTYCRLRIAEGCHCWVYSTCPPLFIRGGKLFCMYRRNWEMDGIEPAEAESRQNPVHLDGYVAAARQGEFQFSCSWLIHTGMPINHQQPWRHHRLPADNEGPCSSYLHCLLLPASSAACRASITLIRCMCITCTCIHFKQAGLLQQLARRHLRHSLLAASQCCVSLPDSLREDGSTIRSQKSSATSFTGCLFDNESTSSWEFWSTSACTIWLLPTWWRWYYPCHTFPDGVCFVHLLTEMLSCRGQRVFGWVLEVSRVLDPHSGTVFPLTWKLQTFQCIYKTA